MENKKLKFSYTVDQRHWVGDGFYVQGLLQPEKDLNAYISPFILMDYAAPKEFSQRGGVFEMVQLWVNLPAKDKMSPPKYQGIESKDIPHVKLGETGELRVIAGEFEGVKGPASTFTPINMYDIKTSKAEEISFKTSRAFKVLVLNGEPINEPIFPYGPFVMNTREEILKAIEDFQNGEMGKL